MSVNWFASSSWSISTNSKSLFVYNNIFSTRMTKCKIYIIINHCFNNIISISREIKIVPNNFMYSSIIIARCIWIIRKTSSLIIYSFNWWDLSNTSNFKISIFIISIIIIIIISNWCFINTYPRSSTPTSSNSFNQILLTCSKSSRSLFFCKSSIRISS